MDQPSSTPLSAPTPLPLRFHAPEGWPAPRIDWLAANQGWDPPASWVAGPDVPPAPAGWTWWSRDPAGWKAMSSRATASFRNGIIVSTAIFLVAAVLTFLPLALHESFSIVFWGALIVGPINVARNVGALRRSRASFTTRIRTKASEVRQTIDAASYSSYLASSPRDALPFEVFLARRSREAWSFTGEWPADQYHIGVTEQFVIAGPQNARGRRIGTVIFAGAAAVAIVAIAVGSLSSTPGGAAASGLGHSTAGQQSSGSSGSSGSSAYDISAHFISTKTATSATCTSNIGCWVVRLKSDPSCTNASLMMDFYTSKTAKAPIRSQDFSVTMKDGTADVAVPAKANDEILADIYQAHCVLRK